MTRSIIVNGKQRLLIEKEKPGKCELCDVCKELRPYGPKDGSKRKNVCFDCAMKDEKEMEVAIRERFDGAKKTADAADN